MTEQAVTPARLAPSLGNGQEDTQREVVCHFNPVSLQYTVSNTLEESKGNNKKQYVSKSVGKLVMDLVFDTTHDGQDVRTYTEQVARFMEPDDTKAPPVIIFEWGKYRFQGMVEGFKETIDFFSPSGVPLRSSVNLTMSRQDKVFEPSDTSGTADVAGEPDFDAVEVPGGAGRNASSTAAQGGNSRAGRAVAAANGQESMRFSSGPMTVGGSPSLKGPAAFSAGGGVGAGTGAGIGGSISAGGGVSAGAGAGGGAGASIGGSIGGQLSAGVSASGGAFAGLRAGASAKAGAGASLDTGKLLPDAASATLSTDKNATFGVGGQAKVKGSASLSADVGAGASLKSRIEFEEQ